MDKQPLMHWEELPAATRDQWAQLMTELTLPPLSLGLGITTEKLAKLAPAEIAALISDDPVLASKLLAVVNSAAMGLAKPVTSLERAVVHLGINLVRIIVVGYHLETIIGRWPRYPRDHFDYIRRWSSAASIIAYHIGSKAKLESTETLGTAALLARLGSFMLGLNWPPGKDYQQVPDEAARLTYERERWSVITPLLSGRLAQNWSLPEPLPTLLTQQCEPLFVDYSDKAGQIDTLVVCLAIVLGAAYLVESEALYEDILAKPPYQILSASIAAHQLHKPCEAAWINKAVKHELAALTSE